jgi:hypothetical protein
MSNKTSPTAEDSSEEVFFTDINAYNALHLGEDMSKIAKQREDTHPTEKRLRQWLTKRRTDNTDNETKEASKPAVHSERFSYQKDEAIEQWYLL